jgi:hypothetical protein
MPVWGRGSTAPIHRFSLPQLRFNGMDGTTVVVAGELKTELRAGTVAAADWFSLHSGFLKFVGGVDTVKYMRPATEDLPPQPTDPDYREGFKLVVAIKGHGLLVFCNNSVLTQPEIRDRFDAFLMSAEARKGMIPYYSIDDPIEDFVKGRDGSFFKPSWTLRGWMPRNPGIFGPELITLPDTGTVPAIAASAPRPSLPPASIAEPLPRRATRPSADLRYNANRAHQAAATSVSTEPVKQQYDPDLDDELPF